MSRQRSGVLIENTIFSIFNTFLALVTSLFMSRFVARSLGPADLGIYHQVLWFAGILGTLIGFGLISTATRFVAKYQGEGNQDASREAVRYILKIEIIICLIVTGTASIFASEIADYWFSPKQSFFFFLSFLGLIPGVITAVFSASIAGIQKFKYFTIHSLVFAPFTFGAKCYVLFVSDWGITGLIWVNIVFSALSVLFYMKALQNSGFSLFKKSKHLPAEDKKQIRKYGLSVFSIEISNTVIWNKSEMFFLGRFCDSVQISFYGLSFNIVNKMTTMFSGIIWKTLFPIISELHGAKDKKNTAKAYELASRYLAFISFPIGVAGIVLAYTFIVFWYGRDYAEMKTVMQILFLTTAIGAVGSAQGAVIYGTGRQKATFIAGWTLAVLNIIMNIFLIRKYGALGAAVSNGTVQVLGILTGIFYVRIWMNIKYPFKSVSKILLSSIIMGIVMKKTLEYNGGGPGALLSLGAGLITYISAAVSLGTFDENDFRIAEKIVSYLPENTQGLPSGVLKKFKSIKKFRKGRELSLLYHEAGYGDTLMAGITAREIRKKHRGMSITVNGVKKELLFNNPNIDSLGDRYNGIDLNYHTGEINIGPHYERCLPEIMCKKAGIENPELKPDFYPFPEEEKYAEEFRKSIDNPYITIQPQSGNFDAGRKLWRPEGWKELTELLKKEGLQTVQLGAPGDEPVPGALNMCGKTDIRQSLMIISRADAHIGLPSSLMHGACAVSTPAVIIFGGFERYRNYKYPGIIAIESDVFCSPCAESNKRISPCPNKKICMEKITAAEVLEACLKIRKCR